MTLRAAHIGSDVLLATYRLVMDLRQKTFKRRYSAVLEHATQSTQQAAASVEMSFSKARRT